MHWPIPFRRRIRVWSMKRFWMASTLEPQHAHIIYQPMFTKHQDSMSWGVASILIGLKIVCNICYLFPNWVCSPTMRCCSSSAKATFKKHFQQLEMMISPSNPLSFSHTKKMKWAKFKNHNVGFKKTTMRAHHYGHGIIQRYGVDFETRCGQTYLKMNPKWKSMSKCEIPSHQPRRY